MIDSSAIVGSDPDLLIERPLFYLMYTSETILPNSEGSIEAYLKEVGFTFHLKDNVPQLIGDNIEQSLKKAFYPIGVSDWNSLFWISHPDVPALLPNSSSCLRASVVAQPHQKQGVISRSLQGLPLLVVMVAKYRRKPL